MSTEPLQPYPIQIDTQAIRDALELRDVRMPPFFLDQGASPAFFFGQSIPVSTWNYPADFAANVNTNGPITTPGVANTVLAEISTPGGGMFDIQILTTVRAVFAGGGLVVLQRRNAANTANLYEVGLTPIPNANDIPIATQLRLALASAEGERFRLVALEAYTGIISGSFFWRRRPNLVAPAGRDPGTS